jgi:hypothetical protein
MKNKAYVKNSLLIILTFCSIFYSRIMATTIRFSLLNLLHFGLVPAVCVIALSTTRIKDSKQASLCLSFVVGLLVLFGVTLASALWNNAGLINAIVSFMMLGEPFMFLLAMACIPVTVKIVAKMKNILYWSVLINFLLAAAQKPLIDSGKISAGGLDGTDGCGGVFFGSNAGGYVSTSVSIAFAMYIFSKDDTKALWLRIILPLAALWQVLFADAKQLVAALGFAWLLMILLNSKDIAKTLKLFIGLITIVFIGVWCATNLEAFSAFTAWARPDLYGPDGQAWYGKFYSIRMILDRYQSPINCLLGLGPGHTVSRLGGWFLRDYAAILGPLGSTTTSIGQDSIRFTEQFWVTQQSTIFSPLFSWAGIWGDLGCLGLGSYFYLVYLTWQHFGGNDILKMTLLNVFVLGFIFTQMEEPGYMIFIAFILGVSWQEQRLQQQIDLL